MKTQKKQKTQVEYSTYIQELDVPFNAKAFMSFCELKEVYNEKAYFVLLHDIYLGQAKNYNAKYTLAKQHEKELLSRYVYDQVFEYTTAWTYKDVLAWFRKHGFPRKSPTVESEYENLPNIYRARFVLRGLEVEESALVLLLVMRAREAEIEEAKKAMEAFKVLMYVIAGISLIASVAGVVTGGSGTLAGMAMFKFVMGIISTVASAITLGVTIYNDISMKAKEKEIQDTHRQTTELMLKNMPRQASFFDQSITDPYAMYANGRIYKQGGAGEEKFDCMLGYQPYRALIEDKFNQSNVYEILSNDRENMAGMNQYLPHLYPDGKWTSKQVIKELLYGAQKYYMPMRIKISQAILRWLTKKGYTTFYLVDKKMNTNPFDSKERYSNRWGFVTIEDNREAYGFTDIRIAYPTSYNSNIPEYFYSINIYTSWDKDSGNNDGKSDVKWHAVTSHSYVTLSGVQTKILKGNQIQLRKSPRYLYYIDLWSYSEDYYNPNSDEMAESINYIYSGYINTLPFAFDSNSYYECEFELWLYGEKEVHIYKSIKKILNYQAVQEYNKEKESKKLLSNAIFQTNNSQIVVNSTNISQNPPSLAEGGLGGGSKHSQTINTHNIQNTHNSLLDSESDSISYIYDEPITFTKPQILTQTSLIHRIRGEHKFNLILNNAHQDPPAQDMRDFYYEEFCQDPYPEIFPSYVRGNLNGLNNVQIQRMLRRDNVRFTSMQPIYKALANPTDETSKFAERVWWFDRLAACAYHRSEPKRVTMFYQDKTEYFNLSTFIEPKARFTAL